jgi:hypothetical protein
MQHRVVAVIAPISDDLGKRIQADLRFLIRRFLRFPLD